MSTSDQPITQPELPIDRLEFKAWLDQQPPDRVIDTLSTHCCFLCSFLKETGQANVIWMGPRFGRYGIGSGDIKHGSIPPWAIDLLYPWIQPPGPRNVSVAQMQDRYNELYPEPTHEQKHPAPTAQLPCSVPDFGLPEVRLQSEEETVSEAVMV